MPRGGRRQGAGAPRGNVNAIKSGRWSRRVRALPPAEREAESALIVTQLASVEEGDHTQIRPLPVKPATLQACRPSKWRTVQKTLCHALKSGFFRRSPSSRLDLQGNIKVECVRNPEE